MTQIKPLLERIDSAWSGLSDLVAKLGPDGLMASAADGWAVKDHLVHVAAWEHSLLGLIKGQDRLAALKYFRDSHEQLSIALGELTDADLEKPYSHYQPSDPDDKRPVLGWVAGNTYEHYAEHVDWINQLIKESSAAR